MGTNEFTQKPELLELQSCNATQTSDGGIKSDWDIKENVSGAILANLPARVSDQDMFSILDFAKKYELKAFNVGIKFQKDKQNSVLVDKNNHLENTLKEVLAENERLATILEHHIKRIGA